MLNKVKLKVIDHARYINILTWLRGFEVEILNLYWLVLSLNSQNRLIRISHICAINVQISFLTDLVIVSVLLGIFACLPYVRTERHGKSSFH